MATEAPRRTHPRPISPHLQIYRPQLTSAMSILHRITGLALAAGALLLVYWFGAMAGGEASFATAQRLMGSFVGQLFLLGWSIALFYHLLNGVRHLFWDSGIGFSLGEVYRSGWAVLIGTAVLTVLAWSLGLWTMGHH